jgi:dienelactone hydrolase
VIGIVVGSSGSCASSCRQSAGRHRLIPDGDVLHEALLAECGDPQDLFMTTRLHLRLVAASIVAAACAAPSLAMAEGASAPETVYFGSADGKATLVAYLFRPGGGGTHPAVVMLHGRAGPYSSNVNAGCTMVAARQASPCNAATLSKRHQTWGQYWAEHGYLALLVDSFGPRGRAHGYGRHSHEDPDRDEVNERTVRPLDAEGALTWLAARQDVRADRVMLQGWSNGASTALNAMYRQATGSASAGAAAFRGAIALYPGCGPRALISQKYEANANVWVFLGSVDEEVSPTVCADILRRPKAGMVDVTLYEGATHDFDDPGAARQAVAANRSARDDVMRRAAGLFDAVH